jgi:hypothetical protein
LPRAAVLFALLSACGYPADAPPIVEVPDDAASDVWPIISRSLVESRKLGSKVASLVDKKSLAQIAKLLDGGEIRRIRVERYSRLHFSSADAVRVALLKLWSLEVDAPQPQIPWAEQTDWTIECRVELKNGKLARLITDGWHSCYQDAEGYRWFYMGSVAAFERLQKAGR